MKHKSIHVDELICAAAKERLAAARKQLNGDRKNQNNAAREDTRRTEKRAHAERALDVDVCALVGVMTIVI